MFNTQPKMTLTCVVVSQGSTLMVVNMPNTTGFSVLASEIPLVTNHVDYQNYGGKFLCQLLTQ